MMRRIVGTLREIGGESGNNARLAASAVHTSNALPLLSAGVKQVKTGEGKTPPSPDSVVARAD